MGVKDLWQLLAPVGRRVSIETLEGKVLAIDMSIWLTQFIKAMRDEEGQMVKNSHIIGTLKRILKLLYHRIRPVFVFDGATPALKLRVIQLRRKTYEKSEQNRAAAIRRLLLAQLKQQITKQANEESSATAIARPQNFSSLFKPASSSSSSSSSSKVNGENNSSSSTAAQSDINSSSSFFQKAKVEDNSDVIDSIEWTDGSQYVRKKALDETEENSEVEDEPMWTLPEDNDTLDVDVLTSLPINIRKRIIEDAKRRERARSRATFIPVADNPILYSQTQLANFLQSSKLNRRFDEAHKKLEGETEQSGKKIAAENKKYQFIPRKGRLQSNKTEEMLNNDSDEDEMFTENDWARAEFQQPTSFIKSDSRLSRRKKIVTFNEELEDEAPRNNTEKSSPQKSNSFCNRFFDDLEEEDFFVVTSTASTIEKTHSNTKTESVASVWEDLVDANRDMELVESTDNNKDDIDNDDEYGTGGGFFVEPESTENTDKEISEKKNVEVPSSPVRVEDIQGENKDVPQPSSSQVDELKQILWEDDNDDTRMDNIEWESDEESSVVTESSSSVGNESAQEGDDSSTYGNEDVSSKQLRNDTISQPKIVIDLSYSLHSKREYLEKETIVIDANDDIDHSHEESTDNDLSNNFLLANNSTSQTESSYTDYLGDVTMSQSPIINTTATNSVNNNTALTRAISTASNMADWAGRVVRRVVKEHMGQQPLPDISPAKVKTFPPLSSAPIITSKKPNNNLSSHLFASDENSQLLTQENESFHMDRTHINTNDNTKNNVVSNTSNILDIDQSSSNSTAMQLLDIDDEIEASKKSLATSARDSERITEEMKSEVLRLIQAFDLPFIIAPFEAEAQCAVLEEMGLVDGVVTEDSDSFLFGAKSVYRNIFNDRKYVEAYYARDIQKELGLTRDDLIGLAFFLGSDYTEGVHGVGIVNAMEIIETFPMHSNDTIGPIDGLKKFRQWLEGYDFAKDILQSIKNPDNSLKRKSSNVNSKSAKNKKSENNKGKIISFDEVDAFSDNESEHDNEENSVDEVTSKVDDNCVEGEEEIEEKPLSTSDQHMVDFEKKHKNARSKWTLPPHFPDESVIKAYLHPDTNRNTDPFPFIPPARSKVRRYIAETLGWTELQLNTQVDPVLERFADRAIQTRMDSFFTMNYQDDTRFAKIASERLREAVVKITGKESTALALEKDSAIINTSPIKKKRHINDIGADNAAEIENHAVGEGSDKETLPRKNKRSRKT